MIDKKLTTDMYVAFRESGPLSTLLILLGPDEKAPGTNIWFVSFALAPSSSSARAKMILN